jgi:hypothetical protein
LVMMSSVIPSEKYSCSASPLMLAKGSTLDLGVAKLAADRPQRGEGPFLVGTHEPRVTGHVHGQNCCQPALGPPLAHLDCRSRREMCDLW